MKDLLIAFTPAFVLMGIVFVFYILPLYWVVSFAKKEHKDWRIALVAGLLFTWLLAMLVVLIVPRLSDEDHERINQPNRPARRSFSMKRGPRQRKEQSSPREPMDAGEWFMPVLIRGRPHCGRTD